VNDRDRILAQRPWWLGNSRWPVAGVIALIAAVVSALGGKWLEAALLFGAALALAVVTLRTMRR
jgi:hypothetical protein